jgi:hypothetical protein
MTRRIAPLIVALAAASCTANRRGVDAIAEGYVRAALQLAQHDPTLVEAWRGPEQFRPGPRAPVAEVARLIDELMREVESAAGNSSGQQYARVRYLGAQLRGLRFAADRQLGQAKSIDDQAREEFGVTFPPLDQAAVMRTHTALYAALPGFGSLQHRLREFRKASEVPASRWQEVLMAALDSCRRATAAVVPLPPDESVAVVLGDPPLLFDGWASYRGNNRTEIEISGGPLDSGRAHRLACHEGYPGHHVQHLLIDRLYADRQWPELLLTPGFGPHLLYAEGAAEVGADLVLTATPVDRLVQDLSPIVTDVARRYLDGSLTQERALERLADEALIANPSALLAFIEQRRARALVYVEGRRLVYQHLKTKDLAGLYDAFRSVAALQ